MAGISNDASLRGKVRAVAKKNGLRAQEVLQMYLFEHLLLRLDWSSIGAHGAAERRGSRGNTAADPGRLLAGDSSGRVPSTWQETAVPSRAAQGRGPRPRRAPCARAGTCPGTPQAPARSLSVPPAHACPARPAQTSPRARGTRAGPWPCARGRGRRTRGTAPATRPRRAPRARGASRRTWGTRPAPARPAGPVGRPRAQRPREPPPLAARPAPSPLAVSCQTSRVSLRHVFSLTTSWRRRGASSCRLRSNRELRIPTLQERALESTQLYPTISFCCLEMVALRRSPPRACVALVGA